MSRRLSRARAGLLRSVVLLGGALLLVAGCVPAEPYYDGGGYAAAPAYSSETYYGSAPYYGGSSVYLYGGGTYGGYRGGDRDWHGGYRPHFQPQYRSGYRPDHREWGGGHRGAPGGGYRPPAQHGQPHFGGAPRGGPSPSQPHRRWGQDRN